MTKRYYLSMLAVFPLLLLFDAIYIPAHQTAVFFYFTAAVHLFIFVLLNSVGIWLLYKPVAASLRQNLITAGVKKRIRRLPWLSALWIFLLGVLYQMGIIFLILNAPLDTGSITLEKMPAYLWLTTIPAGVYLYAVLPAFIIWFVINDFTFDLKTTLFTEFDVLYPARRKKMGVVLLSAFVILGFVPTLLVALELIVSRAGHDYAAFSEMSPLQAILPDRVIILIGMLIAVVFITRSFTKPINALLGQMTRVRRGDLSAQAAISTEDEIGVLTKQFNEMVKGLQEREKIRDTFGKYVTSSVASLALGGKNSLKGEHRLCTILVTDIANYTTLSEALSPEQTVGMLNAYFTALVKIIHDHKGMVNKFIGDSVFALFNVPADDPQHALHALQAAIEIKKLTSRQRFGDERLLITRIGINTGPVIAGNIGSADRLEYTVIGDDVNIAARLEQLNKPYGTRILVGENTYQLTKEHFPFAQLGEVPLKGKEKPVRVYHLE